MSNREKLNIAITVLEKINNNEANKKILRLGSANKICVDCMFRQGKLSHIQA